MSDAHKSREELIDELTVLRLRLQETCAGQVDAAGRSHAREPNERILTEMRAMISEIDEQGRLIYVSPSVTDLLGYDVEEILGAVGLEWVHEDDIASLSEILGKVVETGQTARSLYRARHKDGRWLWLESTGSTYRHSNGTRRIVIFARDVTEVKLAGGALRDSEDRFRALAENASDLVSELDAEGRFLFMSANSWRLFGLDPLSLVGRALAETPIAAAIHPEDRANARAFGEAIRRSGVGDTEIRFRHGDGSWRWLHSTVKRHLRSDGPRWVVISRDVTERKRAERELRESEERYRVVTEGTSDLIVESNAEARVIYMSATSQEMLGYEPGELVGTTAIPILAHPDEVEDLMERFLETIKSDRPVRVDPFRLRHRNGSYLWCEAVGLSYHAADGGLRLVGVIRDVSERIKSERERTELEGRIQQAQKLEGLGVMAGGIAHDFNNLLTPILGDTSLALMDLEPRSPLRERLEKVHRAARRAAALTNQLLAYAGRGPLVSEPINLSQLVLEMAQLLESSLSQKAVLSYEMSADAPPILGDAAQISQVVMNLITNASEAIGDGSGRVAIRTGDVEGSRIPPSASQFGHELGDGHYSYFEVEDNGCGMNSATRARIFDPFFTTKFTGRGLGLAAVLGIVRGHHGAVELESHPSRGTRFRVLLPTTSAELRVQPVESDVGAWQGDGIVLVVDDDEGVRDLVRVCLERAGLSVLEASDGDEATALFTNHASEIDAVLLDCTLPSKSGDEVFAAIRRLRGDVPVVLISGYSHERATENFEGADLTGFLQKPFLPSELVAQVRAAIERR
jgi:two-component system cell cycle sensor histidine kinase/response regulator CckA